MARKKYSASNTLALTSSATELLYDRVDTQSDILFTHSAIPNHKLRYLTDSLTFTDTLSTNNVISQSVSSFFVIGGTLSKIYAIYERAENTLELSQVTNRNIKWGIASSELVLEQDTTNFKPIRVFALSNLTIPQHTTNTEGLRHSLKLRTILNPSAISYVNLSQGAFSTQILTVNNHIHLSHTAELTAYDDVDQQLFLIQEATYTISKPLESTLNLTHDVNGDTITLKLLESTLGLKNVASFYIVNFCEYTPGVGEGDPAPSMIDPTLLRRSSTVLTYPYTTPSITLEIRNPNFDNVEQFEHRKINRRSRGGTLQIYRDPAWPEAERLIMTFSALSQKDVKDLMEFMNKSLGKEIGILDFESRQWRGLILTPSAATSEEGMQGFSATLEFEGTKV